MVNLEGIPRQRLFGGPFILISLLTHSLFFIAIYPSMSLQVMKPNVPVMVRIITDLPKPQKAEAPIKTKTAALSNADRRAKGPKALKRTDRPKLPKVRIVAKATKPVYRPIRPLKRSFPKPVKQKLEPPPLLSPQGVPQLRKLPLLSGADLERYARLDQHAGESEVVSLDTRDFRYISYFATIKRQIELVWSYPKEASRAGIYGELMLRFVILRDGQLDEVRLLRSSGSRILDEEAIRAVKVANPYNPFPRRITKQRLQINAVFSYLPSPLSAVQ